MKRMAHKLTVSGRASHFFTARMPGLVKMISRRQARKLRGFRRSALGEDETASRSSGSWYVAGRLANRDRSC